MKTLVFNIHGIIVKLTSDNPSVLDEVKDEIREFETSSSEMPEIYVNFISDTKSIGHKGIIEKPEKITDTVYSFVNLKKLCGTVTTTKDYSHNEAVLITLSLIGYLVRFRLAVLKDVTAMHSASFALGNDGILVSGHSGAGKTTVSCSFIENNFDYLSDEETLVEKKNGNLSLLSFPRNLRLGKEFIKSVEGKRIQKNYSIKKHEAFYEKGWILNPREIRHNCIADNRTLSLCIILKNSEKHKELRVNPLKDISALYRIISLSEMLSSKEEDEKVYSQIQGNNRKAFEIANFLFDTVPLYEIEYNIKRHLSKLPGTVKKLLEETDGKETIRKDTSSQQ